MLKFTRLSEDKKDLRTSTEVEISQKLVKIQLTVCCRI